MYIKEKHFIVLIYIIYLYLLYRFKLITVNSFCISLIIPATYNDFRKCIRTLELSICNSIYSPFEVIIVVSNVLNKSNIDCKLYNLERCTKRLIIEYRKDIFNAASNRNYGYYLSSCPILTYFDVDDIMSIYRIEIVNKIFTENKNIDIFLHPSTRNYRNMDNENKTNLYKKYVAVNQYKIIKEKCSKTFIFDGRIYRCDVSNGFYITNGWPSLKRIIMKKNKFNESLHSTEDLDFLSRVVKSGYNVAIFKKPLGYYIKDNKCDIKKIILTSF